MATIVPRACESPMRIALPFPPFAAACTIDSTPSTGAMPSSTSLVPSVEPSLTTMISRGGGQRNLQQAIDDLPHGARLVVDGHDDGDQF